MSFKLSGNVFINNKFEKRDIFVSGGKISFKSPLSGCENGLFYDFNNLYILPGLIDVHVHLREPGFLYKETVKSGTAAAVAGGFTAVCSMPNLNPVPDSFDNLKVQTDIIDKDALCRVYPMGSITKGQAGKELSEMEKMERAIAFSDDGRGVQNDEIMEMAMKKCKELGKILVAHCEDNSLLFGGYIHDGEYAKLNGHKGICSESEWKQVERDLNLVAKIGCKYHVCHISTKETVELIRQAKKSGIDVTCETGPHYLTLCDMDIKDEGRFKMNPPIRSAADRDALIEGIVDGTVDMIATDHAPHSAEEKSGGLEKSLNGIVGLETSFVKLYTCLVKKNIISLEKLVEIMHTAPSKRFGIGNDIEDGAVADFAVFNLDEEYKIDAQNFKSMGKSSPFDGDMVFGKCVMTVVDGKVVYEGGNLCL